MNDSTLTLTTVHHDRVGKMRKIALIKKNYKFNLRSHLAECLKRKNNATKLHFM